MAKKLLYIPWFSSNPTYDILLSELPKDIEFIKFDLFSMGRYKNRADVIREGNKKNSNFIKNLKRSLDWLHNLKNINYLIVTMDWLNCFRVAVDEANKLKMTTILVPHEGVMQNENLWYKYPKDWSNDIPLCKLLLLWGDQQERIFKDRGYKGKIIKVGSPKLDKHLNYKSRITRKKMIAKLNLIYGRPVILLVCQYFDTQWGDRRKALKAQEKALLDVLNVCKKQKYNLIVRCPPGNPTNILPIEIVKKLNKETCCAIDGYKGKVAEYIIEANDIIHLSDLILSFNSTMVLEAAIANKPTAILKYFNFKAYWNEKGGVPILKDISDCYDKIDELIQRKSNTFENIDWAAKEYSIGKFDGGSLNRIYEIFRNI